jgi:PAS domain S-box-containing protein
MTSKKEKLLQTLLEIEKEFDQKDAEFREFLEIAPEGIVILDFHSRTFIMCNSNAEKILKYSAEELLSKHPTHISPPFQPNGRSSEEVIEELMEQTLAGEKPVFEWLTVDRNGKTFIAEVRLVLLLKSDQPYVYASFVDITERKKMQIQLEAQNEKLRQIAFMQAHQVRSPVANILGLSSLFNYKNLQDPLNGELLLKLNVAVKAFDEIIKDIIHRTSEELPTDSRNFL